MAITGVAPATSHSDAEAMASLPTYVATPDDPIRFVKFLATSRSTSSAWAGTKPSQFLSYARALDEHPKHNHHHPCSPECPTPCPFARFSTDYYRLAPLSTDTAERLQTIALPGTRRVADSGTSSQWPPLVSPERVTPSSTGASPETQPSVPPFAPVYQSRNSNSAPSCEASMTAGQRPADARVTARSTHGCRGGPAKLCWWLPRSRSDSAAPTTGVGWLRTHGLREGPSCDDTASAGRPKRASQMVDGED